MSKATRITNIEELRDHALQTLEDLENGLVDVDHAATVAKGCDTIMGTVKLQLTYSHMLGERPNIAFLQEAHRSTSNLIEHQGADAKLLDEKH